MPAPPSLRDVRAAAAAPGHAHCKADIGVVSPWLAAQAKTAGLQIDGFMHTADTAAVRHILHHHGETARETKRGHIAVTDADLATIPDILTAPDKVVFGARSKCRLALVAFLKRFPDGVTLYVAQARDGRRDLAAVSMRRYPATIDADRLAANFNLYGRTDGG